LKLLRIFTWQVKHNSKEKLLLKFDKGSRRGHSTVKVCRTPLNIWCTNIACVKHLVF